MTILMAIGRILFSLIFILAGVSKIMNWNGTEQQFVNSLLDLLMHTQEYPWIQHLFDTFLSNVSLLLIVGTVVELLGGLLIFFGVLPRFGALILFLLLIPITLIFHAFWMQEASQYELQLSMFLKNVSLMGGCLILMACRRKAIKEPA